MRAKQIIVEGIHFRSKLEARWYLFFKKLGWNIIYEPEIEGLTGWLPDFLIIGKNGWKTLVDVKPIDSISDWEDYYEKPIFKDKGGYQKYVGNNEGPNNTTQYVTPIFFKPQSILLNPLLISSEFIYSQQPENITGDGVPTLESLKKIFVDNSYRKKSLILKNSNNPQNLILFHDKRPSVKNSLIFFGIFLKSFNKGCSVLIEDEATL